MLHLLLQKLQRQEELVKRKKEIEEQIEQEKREAAVEAAERRLAENEKQNCR